MATAGGGGKIRSKRQHGAGKPYARNKGLLGRVTDNVKNLIPSWLQSYFRTDDSTAAEAAPPTSSAPSRSPSSSLEPKEARPAPLDGFSFAGLNHDVQQNCEVAGDGAKPSTSTAATSGYTVPFPRTRGPQKRQPIDRSHATQHGSLALQSWLPAAGNAAGPKPGDARDVAATGREAGVGSGSASAVATGTRSGQTMPVLSGADGVARDVRDSSSQCEDDSVSTTSGFSSRASDKDVSMQPRGSAVLLQPLWCMGAELPARSTPQPSAHSAKKPSFNLTVFDSSRTAGGLGSGQRGESTFYAGKTTYGGASAMSRPSQRKLPVAPYQAPYRVQVKAKPATPRLTSAVTSVTARRILQSLEKLSSPLSDALKIPSSNTSPSLSGSSYLDPVSSLRAHRLQPQRPPVQQLVTPRAAAVSSSRSLYRRSWAGPSRTASPSPSTTTAAAVPQPSLASDSTQPGTSCDNRTLQSKASLPGPPKALAELATPVANGLPRGGGGGGGGGGGKMKRERIAVHFSAQKDDESESDVALPSVPLPIRAGALPSFSFGPVATSTPANTRSPALAAAAPAIGSSTGAGGGSGSTDKMPFAFTTPPVKATELEQPPTSQPPPFQFSTPVTKAGLVTTPTTLPSSGTGFAFRLPSATQTTPVSSVGVVAAAAAAALSGHKERSGGTTSPAGDLKGSKGMSKRSNDEDNDSGGGPFKAAKTLKSGSVLDILTASSAPKGPGLGEAAAASGGSGGEVRPTASGFGDRFRPPEGSWECNACMVQNQASHVTCVACQASKPTPKRATAPSSIPAANAKPPQSAGPSLAEQFAAPPGSWDCDTCMVSNRGESSRCVACDTPRANLAPKRSALAPPLSTSSSSSAASTFFSTGVSTAPASITKAPASSVPPPAYTKPSAAAAGASSLASLFVRPEGAWDCDVCMVQNKAGSGSCAACQTAKPGGKAPMSSAAPAATPVGFGDKFKRPAGSWDCDTCMVSNSASTDVCACCSTERPGAARPTAQAPAQPDRPTFSFGLSSDDSAASALPSAAATFSFNSQGGFKFGTGSTSASKDTTTTTTPSSTAGASGVTDTSGPAAAAARGFTFGTTAPANDSTVTFGGGFKLPSSDAAETAQTSAATFTFGTKVGAGNSTVSAAATTDSSAAAAALTAKIAEPKGPSGGTFQFGVATPSFGQNALAGGADASKAGAGFAFASDKEAAPATFGGFQFKTSGAAEQPAATATFGAFGGVKRSADVTGPEGKAVPPLVTGFSFSKETAQKTDADESTAKKPFGFATMNPSAAATPGLFGAAAPAPASSAAAPASGSSFSFGTKPIAFGVPVKPDAPAANAGPSTSIGAAPPFMFGPAASVSAAKPDPATGAAPPACSSAQIAPFGFAPSAKLDKPTTTFLFGPGHESQQQQLAGTAANNSATPVAPFVFGKTDASVTNATATNAAAALPVFGAVPKTDAPAANSGVAGAPGSGGSTFMFGPSAGSAASAATAAVTPFGFGGVTGAASSSGAGFGSGSSSIFSAPGSSLPTFGTASSAPPAGATHAFGTQPGGGGDGGGGPGGAPFRQQPPTQPPAFGSSGPSQLAPPAFGFSANQQQAPAFGSGAAPAGGQQPLFSAAVQKPAFGPGGAAGQPAGSGSFQFSAAAPAAAAQGFNFGGASPAPGPSGSSLTFGGSPQQAPGTFQFNARPGFNIGMSGSPANQFQGSSSATLKNRKYKTAVRRRK